MVVLGQNQRAVRRLARASRAWKASSTPTLELWPGLPGGHLQSCSEGLPSSRECTWATQPVLPLALAPTQRTVRHPQSRRLTPTQHCHPHFQFNSFSE